MAQIASFDVFDTVLTRAVGSPSAVFLLLGRRLANMSLIQSTPEAFACARAAAERRAFENAGGIDSKVTLDQIYAELAIALRLTEAQCDRLMHLERALETELLRPVPGARDRVQAARDRGHCVVFTSDMYLSARFIQKQLARHGLWADGDKCYVSSEYGKSKASGELFREVVRCEGVSPACLLHCGNNPEADIQAAKRVGLQAEPCFGGNLNRYEEILESHAWATEGLSSTMAGASRLARRAVVVTGPKQEALRDVSAGVVAPALVGYVLWILQRAQQLGLKRLYFVSRDGQILLEIARRLASKLNVSCELCYLYGSRKAWNLPAMTSVDEEQLSWSWDSTDFFSVRRWLSRVSIEPEEIRESLNSIGLEEEDWSRSLSPREQWALREALQEDDRLHELILERAAQKRQILIRYLEQEGLLDSAECGMVDVGWNGSLYYSLATVVSAAGGKPPVGLYFAMTGNRPLDPRFSMPETYFFHERLGVGFVRVPGGDDLDMRGERHLWRGLVTMLEVFCNADHGTVVDFRDEGARVRPVLKQESNQLAVDWGLPILRKTVYCFVEHLLLDSGLVNPWADVRAATAEVLKCFWLGPTLDEAMAWGEFPFEDGFGRDSRWSPLASSYRWKQVAGALTTARLDKPHRHVWFEGSMALTLPQIQIALRGVIRLRRTLSAVKRMARVLLSVLPGVRRP